MAALQLGGCSSPEERAQKYYENGVKLFSEHENCKGCDRASETPFELKKDLLGAWKLLAAD